MSGTPSLQVRFCIILSLPTSRQSPISFVTFCPRIADLKFVLITVVKFFLEDFLYFVHVQTRNLRHIFRTFDKLYLSS